VAKARRLPIVEHGFTHFRLRAQPWLCTPLSQVESVGRLWVDLADAPGAAVPAPVRTLLRALGGLGPN
jgi:adenine-specific DNA glycosylase